MVGLVLVFFFPHFFSQILPRFHSNKNGSIGLESDSIIVENFGLFLMFLMNKIREGA